MLLTLREEHQNHLQFLKDQSLQVLQDFCQLASIHIEKGPNLKTYNNAAQKLDVSPDVIRHTVEALVFLALEASRFKVSTEELAVCLITLGYSPELREVLSSWIQSQSPPLESLKLWTPHYSSLTWRLEAQLASRSLQSRQSDVVVTMLLTLGSRKVVLRATPSMLRYLASTLEDALAEANSRHARRALRSVK